MATRHADRRATSRRGDSVAFIVAVAEASVIRAALVYVLEARPAQRFDGTATQPTRA
jgi:hypothetical protein